MGRSPSRNERDRRDRHRPTKDHSNDIAKMKEKMRHNLESARNSNSSFAPKRAAAEKHERRDELTAAEHLARTKAIEHIEEGSFQPSTFRSGSAPKKDQKSKKETSHEAAIFGPAWKSAEQRKAIEKRENDVTSISLPAEPTPPIFAMAPMIPSSMSSEHSAHRKSEWKSYWTTQRQELLAQGF